MRDELPTICNASRVEFINDIHNSYELNCCKQSICLCSSLCHLRKDTRDSTSNRRMRLTDPVVKGTNALVHLRYAIAALE